MEIANVYIYPNNIKELIKKILVVTLEIKVITIMTFMWTQSKSAPLLLCSGAGKGITLICHMLETSVTILTIISVRIL